VLSVFDWVAEVNLASGLRCCAFLNAAVELVEESDEPALAVVRGHKAWWLELFRALLAESGVPDRDEVAEELMLLLDGTFARVLVTREVEPAEAGAPACSDGNPGAPEWCGMTMLDDSGVGRPMLAAFGLMFGPAVGLGLASFAYALVLPNMRADLGWSFATAGALNTANAAGYLIGALTAAAAARWFGERRVFLWGLALTGLRRAHRGRATPSASHPTTTRRARSAQTGRHRRRPRRSRRPASGWRAFDDRRPACDISPPPTTKDTAPVAPAISRSASRTPTAPVAADAGSRAGAGYRRSGGEVIAGNRASGVTRRTRSLPLRPLLALLVGHGFFGAGYIAYMTFIVAVFEGEGATSDR
jgi:hypothetical protein